MTVSIRRPITLVFVLAMPFFARPALSDPAHDAGHKAAHHRVADFLFATVLAVPARPDADAHKTDGLSRDPADCSRGGCIDNN